VLSLSPYTTTVKPSVVKQLVDAITNDQCQVGIVNGEMTVTLKDLEVFFVFFTNTTIEANIKDPPPSRMMNLKVVCVPELDLRPFVLANKPFGVPIDSQQ